MKNLSCYYINNTKYLSVISALDSILMELNLIYSHKSNRKIVLVMPDGTSADRQQMTDTIRVKLFNYNAMITDADVEELYSIKSYSEVATDEFLNSPEKAYVLFVNTAEMGNVYSGYINSLLTSIGQEAELKDFLNDVFFKDIAFGGLQDLYVDLENIPSFEVPSDSKGWSYDILLYLRNKGITASESILREKIAVHSNTNLMESSLAVLGYMGQLPGLVSTLNYLEKEHGFDKDSFVQAAYGQDNHSLGVYAMRDLLNAIDSAEGLKDKLLNHTSKLYHDFYVDFSVKVPQLVNVIESKEIDLDNWDAYEFLRKRNSRIPYLIKCIPPL